MAYPTHPSQAGPAASGVPPGADSTSTATRLLCAAVHIDPDLRNRTLDELLYHPHRAVAPAYTVDVVPILRHAWLAHSRVLLRDAVLSVLLVMMLFVWVESVIPAVLLYLVYRAGRIISRWAKRRFGSEGGVVFWAVLGLVLAFWLVPVLLASVASLLYTVGLGYFLGYGFAASRLLGSLLPLLVIVGFVATVLWERLATRSTVVNDLQPESFSPSPGPAVPAWAKRRLDYLSEAQEGNVTVYSEKAGAQPFVGSGEVVSAWNLALPLVEAGSTAAGGFFNAVGATAPRSVRLQAAEVYQATRTAIVGLNGPSLPDHERLHGLSIRDRLYVAGRLRHGSPFIDADNASPVYRVAPNVIDTVSVQERGPVRHYQVVRISGWSGELETTVFLHAAVNGDMLFVEFVATHIPAIDPRYHAIDGWERPSARVVVRAVASSVLDLIRVVPGAPYRLLTHGLRALRRSTAEARTDEAIRSRLSFDFGARTSLRELGTAETDVLFHDLDATAVTSIVQRRVLGALATTLADHGYDLQEFSSRASYVVQNLGTLVSNSTLIETAIATGTGSTATTGTPNAPKPG